MIFTNVVEPIIIPDSPENTSTVVQQERIAQDEGTLPDLEKIATLNRRCFLEVDKTHAVFPMEIVVDIRQLLPKVPSLDFVVTHLPYAVKFVSKLATTINLNGKQQEEHDCQLVLGSCFAILFGLAGDNETVKKFASSHLLYIFRSDFALTSVSNIMTSRELLVVVAKCLDSFKTINLDDFVRYLMQSQCEIAAFDTTTGSLAPFEFTDADLSVEDVEMMVQWIRDERIRHDDVVQCVLSQIPPVLEIILVIFVENMISINENGTSIEDASQPLFNDYDDDNVSAINSEMRPVVDVKFDNVLTTIARLSSKNSKLFNDTLSIFLGIWEFSSCNGVVAQCVRQFMRHVREFAGTSDAFVELFSFSPVALKLVRFLDSSPEDVSVSLREEYNKAIQFLVDQLDSNSRMRFALLFPQWKNIIEPDQDGI